VGLKVKVRGQGYTSVGRISILSREQISSCETIIVCVCVCVCVTESSFGAYSLGEDSVVLGVHSEQDQSSTATVGTAVT